MVVHLKFLGHHEGRQNVASRKVQSCQYHLGFSAYLLTLIARVALW